MTKKISEIAVEEEIIDWISAFKLILYLFMCLIGIYLILFMPSKNYFDFLIKGIGGLIIFLYALDKILAIRIKRKILKTYKVVTYR